nr:cytokine receptor-like [Dermatophagoides farinae]
MIKLLLKIIFITFLIIIYGLFVNFAESCLYDIVNYGSLYPDRAFVEVGKELSFDCKLEKEFVDNGTIDIARVFFDHNEIAIDTRFITRIDPYTVRLSIKNTSLDDIGNYSCKFNNTRGETKSICYSDGLIGYKPLNVDNFKCIYYYREKLLCSWTKPNNTILTVYSLYHYYEGILSEEKPCGHNYSDDYKQYCFWNISHEVSLHNARYYLLLKGENQLGTNEQSFEYDQTSITQLPPPRMKPKSEQFVNGRLQWIPPKSLLVDEKLKNMLQYRISVIDIYNNTLRMIDYNPHKHDGKSMSNNVSLKIKDLRPFTHYRFNISCKIDDSQNPYWSDMISVDILTEPKIPETSPQILNQSFMIDSMAEQRKVVIYWQQLANELKNGPDFEYFVSYSAENEQDWKNQTTLYPNLTLTLNNVSYLFRIYSKNSIGLSNNYSLFILPATKKILWNNDSNVLASMINVSMFPNGDYELDWTSINDSFIKDYTLFWCLAINDHGQCLDQIHWETKYKKHGHLRLPDLPDTHHVYKFGIAYNSHDQQTTGIIWAKCLANLKTKKIDGISFSVSNIKASSVVVNWKLACEAQRSLIDEFEISYCGPQSCKSENADKNENQFTLARLEPNTKYRITVGLPSLPKNNEIEIRTESGVPPSPKEFSCELIDDTEFLLRWRTPEAETINQFELKMTGPLSLFKEFQIKQDESCRLERTCNFTIKNLTGKLRPFSNYSFYLQACNDKHCSKEVQQVYRTKPSNPGIMIPPIVSSINDKLRVHLKPPVEPNGRIDYYHIRIYEQDKLIIDKRFVGNQQYVDVDFDSCKRLKDGDSKEYFLAVKASNLYNNQLFSGNYTDRMQIPLYCSPVYNRILLLIIGFICFIIFLCFVLFCTYRMFKSVKQKNDDFTINIGMEDQSFKDQFQTKFGSNQNYNPNNNDMLPEQSTPQQSQYRETNIDNVSNNNVSESSLMESDLTMANTATNANSSNTINDQAPLSSSGEADPNLLLINHSNNHINDDNHQNNNNNNRNNSTNLAKNSYIKLSTNQFCSSDSGVSDMNHHDNLEYFYNQDDSSLREPFLPNSKKSTQIINNGHRPMNGGGGGGGVTKGIGSFWSKLSSSTAAAAASLATSVSTAATVSTHSAPSSSLPSPEHNHIQNGCSSRTPMLSQQQQSQNQQQLLSSPLPVTTTNINNNNINNSSITKPAYVMIPSSNSPKCLPPSHTTHLPKSYNLNQV